MTDGLRVLRVFLASPGDLVEERQVARQVVDEINEIVRTVRVVVDLLGWEDTRPGAGRPQSLINKDVDGCDLFVGLMWRHWGTPTGTHTSGFEEEFERACSRRSSGGAPEIWLSFKTIGPEHLADPGPQLKRVIDFRQQQIERKEILFKEFDDAGAWGALFRRWLLTYILEEANAGHSSSVVVASPQPAQASASREVHTEPAKSHEGSSQLRELAAYISELDPSTLDVPWSNNVQLSHLCLVTSAALATAYPDVHLGIHEANLVYSTRRTWGQTLLLY